MNFRRPYGLRHVSAGNRRGFWVLGETSSQAYRDGKSVAIMYDMRECAVFRHLIPDELDVVSTPADFRMGNIYTRWKMWLEIITD